MLTLEVCFTPELYLHKQTNSKHVTIIIDVLRASTSICAALSNGVKAIIAVSEIEELKRLKQLGYVIASEREGLKLDFADMGNSPTHFLSDKLKGETIAYSTTNGTRAINLIKDQEETPIYIAAFTNITALTNYIINLSQNVVIVCSGWKHTFSLEDAVIAGAYCEKLLESAKFATICDSSSASIDLWNLAKEDLISYIDKCIHRHRLEKLGLDESIPYCLTADSTNVVPFVNNGMIINVNK
ncbi:MAG: 2-phosphosulfolactate phosphatase [Bacteroidota bacterium]